MKIDWIKAGKSFVIGMVFALFVYLCSTSDSSFGLGLFLAIWLYLRKGEKKEYRAQ